jgi:nucleotide-binding universal stress UspA family protein
VLTFAYDGSLHGGWAAHYAVRFAANTPDRTLRLVHVGEPATSHVAEGIARIAHECDVAGVVLAAELHGRLGAPLVTRLLELVEDDAILVTGTRAHERALFSGSVPARLLAAGRFEVIAIRVVHGGLLGQPGRVLLPLDRDPRAAARAAPLLTLLGADLHRLHVLLPRQCSRASVARTEGELRKGLGSHRVHLDSSVLGSARLPTEILAEAARHRSRLICLRASERMLSSSLLRGSFVDQVLRESSVDVAVYGGAA